MLRLTSSNTSVIVCFYILALVLGGAVFGQRKLTNSPDHGTGDVHQQKSIHLSTSEQTNAKDGKVQVAKKDVSQLAAQSGYAARADSEGTNQCKKSTIVSK